MPPPISTSEFADKIHMGMSQVYEYHTVYDDKVQVFGVFITAIDLLVSNPNPHNSHVTFLIGNCLTLKLIKAERLVIIESLAHDPLPNQAACEHREKSRPYGRMMMQVVDEIARGCGYTRIALRDVARSPQPSSLIDDLAFAHMITKKVPFYEQFGYLPDIPQSKNEELVFPLTPDCAGKWTHEVNDRLRGFNQYLDSQQFTPKQQDSIITRLSRHLEIEKDGHASTGAALREKNLTHEPIFNRANTNGYLRKMPYNKTSPAHPLEGNIDHLLCFASNGWLFIGPEGHRSALASSRLLDPVKELNLDDRRRHAGHVYQVVGDEEDTEWMFFKDMPMHATLSNSGHCLTRCEVKIFYIPLSTPTTSLSLKQINCVRCEYGPTDPIEFYQLTQAQVSSVMPQAPGVTHAEAFCTWIQLASKHVQLGHAVEAVAVLTQHVQDIKTDAGMTLRDFFKICASTPHHSHSLATIHEMRRFFEKVSTKTRGEFRKNFLHEKIRFLSLLMETPSNPVPREIPINISYVQASERFTAKLLGMKTDSHSPSHSSHIRN